MEKVYSRPTGFEFLLNVNNDIHIGHVFKDATYGEVYDFVKESDSNLSKLVTNFGIHKIFFVHCNVEKAFHYFQDAINSEFREKVISLDDMKEIYLKQGLLEKLYLKSHRFAYKLGAITKLLGEE